MNLKSAQIFGIATVLAVLLFAVNGRAQGITNLQRGQVMSMLDQIAPDVQKHYYDPTFHGVNWDAEVAKAKQKIEAAKTLPQAESEIAAAMLSLNDSHTFFLPPAYAERFYYGWQGKMIGDQCFVVHVRPGSNAAKAGVKPGDQVMTINGYIPTRDNFWKMQYSFHTLRPLSFLILDLREPSGKQVELKVSTKVVQKQNLLDFTGGGGGGDIWQAVRQEQNEESQEDAKLIGVGNVGVLKFPEFLYSASKIDHLIGKARKYKALVIDLRGDPGGSVDTLKYLIGDVFDHKVTIADQVGRKERKTLTADSHHNPFQGKLVVLVDSKSASAAELFARVVQLEKRGTVVGDRSEGAVMEAKEFSYKSGVNTVIFFGASITSDDLIMTDGKSLEHRGVIPDVTALPTAQDIADGSDPVMARAVQIAGGTITPAAAGKLFPYKWPRE